jgi:hypothetical protein
MVQVTVPIASFAKKETSPLRVISEVITYGYEGDPNDGYLSSDEKLVVRIEGSLKAGETYRYQFREPCMGARFIWARAGVRKGPRKIKPLVRIWTDKGVHEGPGEACIINYHSKPEVTQWWVEVTNTTGKDLRVVHLWVLNEMELGQSCP